MSKFSKWLVKNFWVIMIAGLLVRLILAGITSWNNDIRVWFQFAADLKSGIGVYTNKTFSYPPGLAAILSVVYYPLTIFSNPSQWSHYSAVVDKLSAASLLFWPNVATPFFAFYSKIPLFLAEIGFLLVLYSTYKKNIGLDKIKLILLFFYLNPLVIFVSAIHGQLDLFPILVLAAGFLFYRKQNFFWSGILIGLATTMKLYPALIFLPLLFYIFSTGVSKQYFTSAYKLLLGFLLPVSAMLVYMIFVPASSVVTFTRFSTIGFEGSMNFAAINYLPFLQSAIFHHQKSLSNFMTFGLYFSPFVAYYFARRWFYKNKIVDKFELEKIIVTTFFLIYFFSGRTDPNYLLWALPFLLALVLENQVKLSSILSFTGAGFLFYLGIHSMSWKVLFFPLSYFGYSIQNMADQYIRFSQIPGLINSKIYADIFLFSAIWLIAAEFSIIRQMFRNQIRNPNVEIRKK
ncbi:MAG: glycosyltransferase 87 family protein [Candidatus Berkelbacteria bacterium]|nr:glycosyltransferase 87 family protein [Candidatus Berkelbacteria bacterium]